MWYEKDNLILHECQWKTIDETMMVIDETMMVYSYLVKGIYKYIHFCNWKNLYFFPFS